MPIPDDYRDICEMLLKATNEGRVNWMERGNTFIVRLPEYKLEIWSGTDEIDQREFVAVGLRKLDESKLLDNWYVEEGDRDFAILHDLFGAARRKARRLNEKLDSLRELLKSSSPIGIIEDE